MGIIKKYIDCYIPVTTCNLKCSYCYIAQQNLFKNEPFILSHNMEEIKKAFSQERLGGVCLVNLCAGGETLIYPEIANLVKVILLQGHFVMIVTNGLLTNKIYELMDLDYELRKRIFFK